MTPADLLILTLLVVVMVVATGLLVAGAGLLLRGLAGKAPAEGANETPIELLDRQWRIEQVLYRHHRLVGSIIVAAGIWFVWRSATGGLLAADFMAPGYQPFWYLLVAGKMLNIVIGAIIFVRPSRLKPVEAVANRWFAVDTRHLARFLDRHPLLRGLLVLLIALTALAGSAVLLADRLAIAA